MTPFHLSHFSFQLLQAVIISYKKLKQSGAKGWVVGKYSQLNKLDATSWELKLGVKVTLQ